jgi:serine/threonine protein kinase
MSPEQVRGLPSGPASDIFSLGCVLYEMVSGRRAFRGQSEAETMSSILRDAPEDLAAYPYGQERATRRFESGRRWQEVPFEEAWRFNGAWKNR